MNKHHQNADLTTNCCEFAEKVNLMSYCSILRDRNLNQIACFRRHPMFFFPFPFDVAANRIGHWH